MAIGDIVRHNDARSALIEAEQLILQGDYTQAIQKAFEMVEWAVGRVDAVEPIPSKSSGVSKTDRLLQMFGLRHLSYSGGFPPVVRVLVSAAGAESVVVRSNIANADIPNQVLARCAQIIAGIEKHVGSLDAPYGKTIPPSE